MKTLIALMLLSAIAEAGTFTEHVGTHYAASWSTAVRTPRDVTDSINTTLSYADNYSLFAATAPNLPLYNTAVLQVFGGRETDNVSKFLNAIKVDLGAGYRAHMLAKALLTPANTYWQIGNEINNGQKLSPSIHAWLGDGLAGGSNDLSIIPTYAEMWFAPAASGLRAGGAKVVLGSVANAAHPAAILFLETLLDYQLTGAYAPDLAGMKVRDLIDVGSIHYSQGTTTWQEPIAVFNAKPVWHTEEVGGGAAEKGMCMPLAVKAIGRMFSGNPNGKVFLWGTNLGANPCDQWMPTLTGHIGANGLSITASAAIGTVEAYTYKVGTTTKKAVFAFGPGSITSVTGTGTVYVFRAAGVEQYPAAAIMSVSLGANDSVFATIE